MRLFTDRQAVAAWFLLGLGYLAVPFLRPDYPPSTRFLPAVIAPVLLTWAVLKYRRVRASERRRHQESLAVDDGGGA